jgi:hypothetical protein
MRAMALLDYTLEFALHLRKCMENLNQGSRVVSARCVDLAVFLGAASTGLLSISPPRLPVGGFSHLLVGTSAFHIDELRGSRIGEE